MEDFTFMKQAYDKFWIGGVFDGHGGQEVAQLVNYHFFNILTTNQNFVVGNYKLAL